MWFLALMAGVWLAAAGLWMSLAAARALGRHGSAAARSGVRAALHSRAAAHAWGAALLWWWLGGPLRPLRALAQWPGAWWRAWRARRAVRQARREQARHSRTITLPDGTTEERPAPVHSLALRAALWEGKWGPLPRPVNEQYLSSFAALRRLADRAQKTFWLLLLLTGLWLLFVWGLSGWHQGLRRWHLVATLSWGVVAPARGVPGLLAGLAGSVLLSGAVAARVRRAAAPRFPHYAPGLAAVAALLTLGAALSAGAGPAPLPPLAVFSWWQPALARAWAAYLGLAAAFAFCGVVVFAHDTSKIWAIYLHFKRDTYGTAGWATMRELAAKGFLWEWDPATLVPFGAPPRPSGQVWQFWRWGERQVLRRSVRRLPRHPLAAGYVPFAPLGRTQWFCLPLDQFARHCVVYGPPGSGKSASFLILQARAFARLGSAIILDLKGELWAYTARYYERSYRVDLMNAATSDRLLLGRLCRGNESYAFELASLIIGYDPNKQGGENAFWPQSATMLLTCLFLHLAEENPDFTPADIFAFLAAHQYDATQKDPDLKDPLTRVLQKESTEVVRQRFSPFGQLDGKTKSNIVITMAASLGEFMDPAVKSLFSPPTDEEAARGCRVMDPVLLRKKGTAVYVVVAEGRASQLANVLGTVFGTLTNALRRTGDPHDFAVYLRQHAPVYLSPERAAQVAAQIAALPETLAPAQKTALRIEGQVQAYLAQHALAPAVADPAYCLLQFDEAGNVPLRGLAEDIGVGRGRRMPYFLGYQNLEQPVKQYGADYAKSLNQSIGTRLGLPAISSTTAEFFVNGAGKTTAFSVSSDDAEDNRLDSERKSEIARDLIMGDELRTLPPYSQAILLSLETPPVRLSFPPNAKETDGRKDAPVAYGSDALAGDGDAPAPPGMTALLGSWGRQDFTTAPSPGAEAPAPAAAAPATDRRTVPPHAAPAALTARPEQCTDHYAQVFAEVGAWRAAPLPADSAARPAGVAPVTGGES